MESVRNIALHLAKERMEMPKSIVSLLGTVAILSAVLVLLTACDDDAQSVREANRTLAAPTAMAEAPTAEAQPTPTVEAPTAMAEAQPTPTVEAPTPTVEAPTSTVEAPTPSAEIQTTELQDGDCINSTIPDGISIDTVVIVPCSGDWQYRVLNSFQVADASTYPGEESFSNQLDGNCDRQTSLYLHPTADSWELGHRTITCLQHAPDLVISELLEGTQLDAEELSEDQRSCLREWVAGADFIALATAPEDPAVIDDFAPNLWRCVPDLLISPMLRDMEVEMEELSEDERSCLREWVAGAGLTALATAPEDPAVIADFVANLWRCVPDLLISPMLGAMEVEMEELSEDERSCLREWVAGADLIALATAPEDPAVIDDFVTNLWRCVPGLLDSAASTGTSAVTPTPEPTLTPKPTPTPPATPTPEQAATPTTTPTVASDAAALAALYEAANGANWKNNDNWLSGRPIGEWHGVTTDRNDRVTELDLSENRLTGSIPAELGSLSNLTLLYLWGNNLSGEIPPELGNLTHLELLSLAENRLTGSIPAELGSLSNLTLLYLWGNNLSGEIPPELGNLTHLELLSLAENRLTGSIPVELGSLSNLTELSLWGNSLSGGIPPEIGGLTHLEFLDLAGNRLTGSIPVELGSLSNLTLLYLWGNNLSGGIPPELGNLTHLELLSLSENRLTGSIPVELGSLSNLTELSLWGNNLSGEIPPEIGGLTNLESLVLAENQLTGSIPPGLGRLSNLLELFISSNGLTGCLPVGWRSVSENDLDEVGLPFCDITSTVQLSPIHGPVDGVITHELEKPYNFFQVFHGPTIDHDMMAEVTFHNPYPASEESWNYGFLLRNSKLDVYHWLYVDSKGEWGHEFRLGPDHSTLPYGNIRITNLDTTPGGSNKIRIVMVGDRLWAFVNGEFQRTSDLSAIQDVAPIALVIDDLREGETRFEGFTVWKWDPSLQELPEP